MPGAALSLFAPEPGTECWRPDARNPSVAHAQSHDGLGASPPPSDKRTNAQPEVSHRPGRWMATSWAAVSDMNVLPKKPPCVWHFIRRVTKRRPS
jgi:hypothetical protein